MSRADMLAQSLDDFLAVVPEVEAAAVVSADGLPMASALPEGVEEDRLAAMSAALLTLGDRAAAGLGKGELSQVFVEGEHGHVILMAAGEDAVLVAVTAHGTKIGLVLFEMRRVATMVSEAMSGPGRDLERAAPSFPEPPGFEQAEQTSPVGDLNPFTSVGFTGESGFAAPEPEAPEVPAPAPVYYSDDMASRSPEHSPSAEAQPSVSVWE